MHPRVLLACLAVTAGGCDTTLTGYEFNGRGVYEAPRSGVRMQVIGGGDVSNGHDHSDNGRAVIRLCPPEGSAEPSLTLKLDSGAKRASWVTGAGSNRAGTASWTWSDAESSFAKLLEDVGYEPLDSAELEEMVKAIHGVRAGPKAMLLRGQTEHLEVVSAHVERRAATLKPWRCATIRSAESSGHSSCPLPGRHRSLLADAPSDAALPRCDLPRRTRAADPFTPVATVRR